MKLVKMSLLAATLIASSAFAIDNIKVDGDAKLFYSTQDGTSLNTTNNANNPDSSLFRQEDSIGEAALRLGVTADLTEGISAGATLYAVSTLGLYNNLVGGTWTGGINDNFWFGEAWLAGTVGKTTGKIGRMTLDTPLVFTETWSIVPNTFEAAVVINQDIPDTTLVGAYVGQSNDGILGGGITDNANGDAQNNIFSTFHKGAYTVGAINNSWEPLTVQAWYYQAQSILNTYWLQADLDIYGLQFGGQFVGLNEKALSGNNSIAAAAKIAYEMKDTFAISGAYSHVSSDQTTLDTGANLGGSGQSKLYTEAWLNYGVIGRSGTSAFNITATTDEALTWAQLGAYITAATTSNGTTDQNLAATDATFLEVTLEATKSFGPLDVGIYYILTDRNDANLDNASLDSGKSYNTAQAYLTYNF